MSNSPPEALKSRALRPRYVCVSAIILALIAAALILHHVVSSDSVTNADPDVLDEPDWDASVLAQCPMLLDLSNCTKLNPCSEDEYLLARDIGESWADGALDEATRKCSQGIWDTVPDTALSAETRIILVVDRGAAKVVDAQARVLEVRDGTREDQEWAKKHLETCLPKELVGVAFGTATELEGLIDYRAPVIVHPFDCKFILTPCWRCGYPPRCMWDAPRGAEWCDYRWIGTAPYPMCVLIGSCQISVDLECWWENP